MISNIIKRVEIDNPLWRVYEKYMFKTDEWSKKKTVCIINGLAGCGKTTYVLEYLKNKPFFYYSFAGYGEELAEKLISEYVTETTGIAVSGWSEAFEAIAKKFKYIVFDDLSAIASYKRFKEAFYNSMITKIQTRPFIVLVTQPDDDVEGMADDYDCLDMGYFRIPELMKLYPVLSKHDILGLCAVTGGIPGIFSENDDAKPFEENLRSLLEPSSAFVNLMPELLLKYLRKPEVYHQVMHAIANGNHRISDIGKHTGFAYNKCDNYLSRLIDYKFVATGKKISDRGAEKTVYHLTNSYFRLWYLYIFKNRTKIRLLDQSIIDGISRNILNKEIHAFHLQKAFALANRRAYWGFVKGSVSDDKIVYKPQRVRKGNFSYTFDAIARRKERAVFIKVFKDPLENCKKDELERVRYAISLANKYYDSDVFIFAKRRFSDYAVKEAGRDDNLHLVEVDRLKY